MSAICYRVLRDVDVPMRDGARLKADLWLPDVERRVPVILYRTPYGKSNTCPDFLRPQHCVEAGFAAVVQDTRGRFASQGQWRPVMWDQEALDGCDSVEWLAGQDWCNGNVGMSGPSYLGISQLVCAALRPPHLKAIAPALTSTAEFDRIETGGAMRLDHIIGWVAFMALDWLQKRVSEGRAPTPQETAQVLAAVQDPRPLFDYRPLRDIALFKLPGFPLSFDDLMSALAATENIDARDIEIPVLHTGGWYDVFARSTVGMFRRQLEAGHRHSHLLMGCWTHAGTLPQYHGQVNFGVMASGAAARVHEQHLNFFRRHLLQEEIQVPRVKYFLMGSNTWHEAQTWPPPGTTVRRLYLQAQQSHRELTVDAPGSPQSVSSYIYDPADPTPACGGRTLYLGRLAMGPIDQAPLQRRADVLTYLGQPLPEALDIVGGVTVQLHVSSTALDTDFIVKLVDVSVGQVALPVCEGALRMRWRQGFSAPHPYVSGTVERISISLGDVAWRVQPGHRLGLQIQSASYPHLDPNMNTGGALGAEAGGVPATNSIHHDPEHLSWLEINVVTAMARGGNDGKP